MTETKCVRCGKRIDESQAFRLVDGTYCEDCTKGLGSTCKSCIRHRVYKYMWCHEENMCRYLPEIYLIEQDLLEPKQVKFGEWNPFYKLKDGGGINLENKKEVTACFKRLKSWLGD